MTAPHRTPEPRPYYGMPHQAATDHTNRCKQCQRYKGRETCPRYAAIDRDFYRQHVAEGGAPERHWSAPKVREVAPAIGAAGEGSDLRERS